MQTGSAPGKTATVSLLTATSLVVADMIGVGVFTSLGFQVKDIPSGFSLMALWFVGGVAALCGALCYAELGAMFPRSSGEYNFLGRAFNPLIGFLAGWISATVGFAAPVALAALAFGEYGKGIFPGAPPLLLGLGVIWLVSFVQLRGVSQAGTFQVWATALKIALILAFIIAGLFSSSRQPISFVPTAADPFYILSAPFAISLVFVMYSYSGWNAATYIIGEIKDPGRILPRALLFGTAIVTGLYLLLNAVFLLTTPIDKMVGQIDVALIAGGHIFGEAGGRIVGGLICLGLISSISAMMWIGPRVAWVIGEDLPIFRVFTRVSSNQAPTVAILFQMAVASLLLLTQSFEAVLDFIQFSLTLSSFMTVLGMMILRYTQPDAPRPYRAWGYPVTPLVFLSVCGFMMYHLIITRPVQSFAGFLMMLLGAAVYVVAKRVSQPVPLPK